MYEKKKEALRSPFLLFNVFLLFRHYFLKMCFHHFLPVLLHDFHLMVLLPGRYYSASEGCWALPVGHVSEDLVLHSALVSVLAEVVSVYNATLVHSGNRNDSRFFRHSKNSMTDTDKNRSSHHRRLTKRRKRLTRMRRQ